MKSYRNIIAALVMAFVFSTPGFAGDGVLWTDRNPPPPPQPAQATGIIHTDMTAPAPEESVLTEIALDLLQTLITLL